MHKKRKKNEKMRFFLKFFYFFGIFNFLQKWWFLGNYALILNYFSAPKCRENGQRNKNIFLLFFL